MKLKQLKKNYARTQGVVSRTELLSVLAAKGENLLKLMLQKEIDDEIPMETGADIVKTVDYHDVILSLESPCNEDD